MCKVFGLTNTSKVTDHKKLTDSILKNISKYERDGLGFEFIGQDGTRLGQRAIGADLKFTLSRKDIPRRSLIDGSKERWGTYTGKTQGPAIFHSRTSTNNISLENTHPLRSNGFSLIHNGVVTDHGPKYSMKTTNDTEHLLNYIRQDKGLELIEKNLSGYYACLVIRPDNTLQIFLDDQAPLYTAFCEKLDTWVFCTSLEVIESVWTEIGLINSLTEAYRVRSNYNMIWNGNDLVLESDIIPRGYSIAETQYASLSLGRNIQDYSGISYKDLFTPEKPELKLTSREIDYTEYILDSAYEASKGRLRVSIIDESGLELDLDEVSELSPETLVSLSILEETGHVIDINNYHYKAAGNE